MCRAGQDVQANTGKDAEREGWTGEATLDSDSGRARRKARLIDGVLVQCDGEARTPTGRRNKIKAPVQIKKKKMVVLSA